MAKLKCDVHNRRVMKLASSHFTHRDDGTTCDSPTATINDVTHTPNGIVMFPAEQNLSLKEEVK